MKGVIVYWSMTGNTEGIAQRISEDTGFDIKSVSNINVDEALKYDVIVLGCPAMGAEELESEEFKPFNDELIPQALDKKIFLFGSYDWGDGEWMRSWQESVNQNGIALLCDGLIVNGDISVVDENKYQEFISSINNCL